jgi:hypothetical protein
VVLLLLGLTMAIKWVRRPARVALGVSLGVMGAWIACGGGGAGPAPYTPPPVGIATLSAKTLTFVGQKVLTTSPTQTVTVSNTGQATLYISNIENNGNNPSDFAVGNGCGPSINVSASCTLSLTFTPQSAGARSSTIIIVNNSENPLPSISVSGTGTLGQATFTPPSLTFASQKIGTTSPAQPMTLSNTGQALLNIIPVSVVGLDFLETDNCPSSLAVGAACTLSLTFSPKSVGAITDQLIVDSDGVNQTQLANLNGTGAPPTTASGNYLVQVNATMVNDEHVISIPITVQ